MADVMNPGGCFPVFSWWWLLIFFFIILLFAVFFIIVPFLTPCK